MSNIDQTRSCSCCKDKGVGSASLKASLRGVAMSPFDFQEIFAVAASSLVALIWFWHAEQ